MSWCDAIVFSFVPSLLGTLFGYALGCWYLKRKSEQEENDNQ